MQTELSIPNARASRARLLPVLLGVAIAALIVACGGSSRSNNVVPSIDPNAVPPSASASITGFVSFLLDLMPSENTEPLNTDAATPPASDNSEPITF